VTTELLVPESGARVQISIDTEQDAYDDALATLRAAYGVQESGPGANSDTGEPAIVTSGELDGGTNGDARHGAVVSGHYYPGGWNRDRLRAFAHSLAPDAAEAVRFIAAHAPAVSVDKTVEHMGKHLNIEDFSGRQMGGRMASIGYAWKSVRGAKAPPLERDTRNRVYRIDRDVAAMLGEIMGAPERCS
jgi:hypothetical protein